MRFQKFVNFQYTATITINVFSNRKDIRNIRRLDRKMRSKKYLQLQKKAILLVPFYEEHFIKINSSKSLD